MATSCKERRPFTRRPSYGRRYQGHRPSRCRRGTPIDFSGSFASDALIGRKPNDCARTVHEALEWRSLHVAVEVTRLTLFPRGERSSTRGMNFDQSLVTSAA